MEHDTEEHGTLLEPGVIYMVGTVLTNQIYRYLYTRAHYPIVTMFGD